jgi:hypothetical protein
MEIRWISGLNCGFLLDGCMPIGQIGSETGSRGVYLFRGLLNQSGDEFDGSC